MRRPAATYRYYGNTATPGTLQHAFMEFAIPVSVFGGETPELFQWRPSCGDDELNVRIRQIPEPGLISIAVAGVAALVALRRRRRA